MKIGIIGYGSMGKMLLWKFSGTGIKKEDLYAANRTAEKLEEAKEKYLELQAALNERKHYLRNDREDH